MVSVVNRFLFKVLTLGLVFADAQATEGAMGRPLTGMQITPFSGLVPPTPGMQWSIGYLHYSGDIGASRQVPIAGRVSLGLEADIDLVTATGVYIWPTATGRWNFASMLTVPYIGNEVAASVATGAGTASQTQDASGLFDLYFAPVIASYHVSEFEHWSFAAYIYAPTAEYDTSRLANPGLNVWTVSPTVGYTHLFKQGAVEVSATGALDWYSENDDTEYENGLVARLEALAIVRNSRGWGLGVVAGYIDQVQDDSGALADRVGGFQGRSVGLGPIVSYSKKWPGGEHVDFTFRYVKEFNVSNRFEGEPMQLSIGLGF